MEFTSMILYGKDLTYYNVATRDGQTFTARLLQYNGSPYTAPPKEIVLQKEGDQWCGNADEDILHFLGFDINRRLNP